MFIQLKNNTNNQMNHRAIHPSKSTLSQTKPKDDRQSEQKRRNVPAERAQKIRVSDPGEFKLARIESRKMAGCLPIVWTGFQIRNPNKKLILQSKRFCQNQRQEAHHTHINLLGSYNQSKETNLKTSKPRLHDAEQHITRRICKNCMTLHQTSKEGFSSTSSQAWQGESSQAATANVEKQALILSSFAMQPKTCLPNQINTNTHLHHVIKNTEHKQTMESDMITCQSAQVQKSGS